MPAITNHCQGYIGHTDRKAGLQPLDKINGVQTVVKEQLLVP